MPTGIVEGETLVCLMRFSAGTTVADLQGWTQLDYVSISGAGAFPLLAKTAGASEPSTYTFELWAIAS